jgi:hypothetical protein
MVASLCDIVIPSYRLAGQNVLLPGQNAHGLDAFPDRSGSRLLLNAQNIYKAGNKKVYLIARRIA